MRAHELAKELGVASKDLLEKLAQAAEVLSRNPAALQLRYLQTLAEIATEKNSTTIFPVPIDLIEPFLRKQQKAAE